MHRVIDWMRRIVGFDRPPTRQRLAGDDLAERHRSVLLHVSELTVRLLVAAIWIKSGAAHVSNPYFFLKSIHQYRLTIGSLTPWNAVVIPYLQIILACLFLSGMFVREAYVLSAFLALAFAISQLVAYCAGLEIDCGCFGPSESDRIGPWTIFYAAGLFACCLAGFIMTGDSSQSMSGSPPDGDVARHVTSDRRPQES